MVERGEVGGVEREEGMEREGGIEREGGMEREGIKLPLERSFWLFEKGSLKIQILINLFLIQKNCAHNYEIKE